MRASNLTSRSSGTNNNTHSHGAGSNNLIYNLPEGISSRTMCAISADEESHRFVVGTCSLQAPNTIHVLNYSEDTNTVDLETVLPFD